MTKSVETAKALIYLRVARDEPPREAAARQRRACERRAAELGLEVAGIYTDRGSGNRLNRPGLAALLGDLDRRDDVAYVITFDHGRVALKIGDYSQLAWTISKAGARLEIASMPHREATEVELQLIARIGSVQLAETARRLPPCDEPDSDLS
ncbi:recombinase family protein [Amycolatopsis sp. CA-126428]|uniref:recombinase family protein n=1 Tax=Amycolatopsis sp. CA-126428 TaxID=2073158 RepID=UPI000CD0D7CC|nr:recombinase family protein [Amycolatopsis sp. CA-126428]